MSMIGFLENDKRIRETIDELENTVRIYLLSFHSGE
jgi:hypothetical protein